MAVGLETTKTKGVWISMKIYMATWIMEVAQKEALDKKEKPERLMSYYFIKTSDMPLKDYMKC